MFLFRLKVTKGLNLLCRMVATLVVIFSVSAHGQSQKVLTDTWPPYINPEGDKLGSAAKLIEIVFDHVGDQAQWHYLPYELSYHQVKQQHKLASFPYFKTAQRSEDVLFSAEVFSVTSKIYYNRQFLNAEQAKISYKDKRRMGKVAGYSYGVTIDKEVQNAKVFASEEQALTALFNHEIDLLPMTQGVMNYQLSQHFPLREQLILPVAGISDNSSLHVIASKNAQGKQLIAKINATLAQLKNAGMTSLQTTASEIPKPVDVAKLITSEGYPLIMGQSDKNIDDINYFTLPQGTKVLVIQWSNKIIEPSKTDRIYKNMMDLSKVVILTGPHVGKELYVRNMHIELL